MRLRAVLMRVAGEVLLDRDAGGAQRAGEALAACEAFTLRPAASSSSATAVSPPVPAASFPPLAEEERLLESVLPAYMGIDFRPLEPAQLTKLHLHKGVVTILHVYPESPAERAGLEAGDLVLGPPEAPFEEPNQVREWTMRRQIDHHLARARAIGRRSSAQARSPVWPSLQAVERAVARLHENVTVDLAGDKEVVARVERQDLDEIAGNLIENAAKYGHGRVFVTVKSAGDFVEIEVEDDGPGIPERERAGIFDRGARLDMDKPGTGLGLAIVRDVAQIYGGSISLEESEYQFAKREARSRGISLAEFVRRAIGTAR